MIFDILAKIGEENGNFDQNGVYIVGLPKKDMAWAKNKRGEAGGYYFSQKETLEAIDLASASKFRRGSRDEEGKIKTYINIVNFYRDVTKMKINIDVNNYVFEPTDLDYVWPVWAFDRKFKQWASDESYDDQIDEYTHSLAMYGTTVSKRLKDCSERVLLRSLRNTQTAKTLYQGCINGGFATIENSFHYNEMKKYPGWDIDFKKVDKTKSYCVYERYGLVPKGFVQDYAKGTRYVVKDGEEMVLAQAIVSPEMKGDNLMAGRVLFMVELDEKSWPLEEAHTEKVDGRWLGRGEIEKQLENQIARNLTANLRRRGLVWATKRLYQSSDEEVQKNLLMEVQDGAVIKIKPNGNITPINTQTQHLGDFTADEKMWMDNSQQNAFAFESATGESMPSNTPFRLGILLSQQVASHFSDIRKTFGNFLKRSFFDQLIPIFQSDYNDEHQLSISMSAGDIDRLKDTMITFHTNLRYFDALTNGSYPAMDQLRAKVTEEFVKSPYLFVDIPEGFYKNITNYMRLNLTDDTSAEITTLTTLYQSMVAKNDPRAEMVLRQIFAKQGKSLDALIGPAPQPTQSTAQPTPSQQADPSLQKQPEQISA